MAHQLFLFLLSFFWLTTSYSQSFYADLNNTASDHNLVGMSVSVICNGEVSDIFHYGKADLSRDIDISDSTMYRIASISKMVTATALMQLFEDGLFNLDDNITHYIGFEVVNPHYPEDSITFRQLLSHTSGLIDGSGYGDFLYDTYAQMPPPHLQELLVPGGAYYTSDMWLFTEPGTYFSYSNLNFGVIATLIENISGQRFDLYVRENILIPLDIEGSFNVRHISNINNVAVLYRNGIPQADNYQGVYPPPFDSTQYAVGNNGLIFSPQGGLRISALDLSKILIAHANGGIYQDIALLEQSTTNMMHEAQWTYNGNNGNNYYNLFNSWGLGTHITTNTNMGDIVIDGINMYGHPGEAYGLISDLYFEKEKQFGLIFMTNGYFGTSGYQWGNYSAFYLPEEEIFSAVEYWHYQNCDEISSVDHSTTINENEIFYRQENKTLYFPGIRDYSEIIISDITGKHIYRQQLHKPFLKLDFLKNGIYITSIVIHGQITMQKIIVL